MNRGRGRESGGRGALPVFLFFFFACCNRTNLDVNISLLRGMKSGNKREEREQSRRVEDGITRFSTTVRMLEDYKAAGEALAERNARLKAEISLSGVAGGLQNRRADIIKQVLL